ncbi:siderophore-interacting protein [Rudaeicoccus suwonensis]|uniref:NADPH-dependent ferric siderophore reductase n=1 Tax=Rudaeicoccus suwonensis TaxID=657409 RepID=A0A561E743_9MICO|nr:siderophore-interacting protein [Rudaeicoccus suwonensis]TWE11431.1 NADPH-dependent ferric siderophore reductase [Rudaeicoccus suwonensis]
MAKTRVARNVHVLRSERLTRDLIRVFVTGDDLATLPELTQTDHYVKLLFPPQGADYTWPFDPEQIREDHPREQWPVTRTYTIRSFDPQTRELAIDFVVHGDSGLAGPWAAAAEPGDPIAFFGPGGGWAPDPAADVHLLVGDEAAAPAIAAALDALPLDARTEVFVEVADSTTHVPLRTGPHTHVTWVHRDEHGGTYGEPLAAAVRAAGLPEGDVRAFVHGNAALVKDLRRFLFVECGLPRDQVSISGYWRTDQTEDAWQAGKREFVQQMESDEAQLLARASD